MSDEHRVPPSSPEVEEQVLGTLLIDQSAIDVAIDAMGTDSEVFYTPVHQLVYDAILDLHQKGKPVDALIVETRLKDDDKNHASNMVSELTNHAGSIGNIEYYCEILVDKWARRKIIENNISENKQAYDSAASTQDIIDTSMKNVDNVASMVYRRQGIFASDMMAETLDDIQFRRDNPGIVGVPAGFSIDKYTGGWQDGDYYIIAARPSIGKTAFAFKAAFNAALFSQERYRTVVHYTNMEMKNRDLIKRRLAIEARVNYIKMRDGNVSDIEMKRLVEAASYLFDSRLIIDEAPGININEWRAKYKMAVHKHGVGIGFVDYLQLMSGDNEGNREQEISSISRGLKATALETNTPIIALSQLSREPEKREGAEPFLSDLRESGSLEQDADGVIMLNRPEFFGHKMFKDRPTKGKGWVKVAKMRNGMTGDWVMYFNKQFADWRDTEWSEDIADSASGITPPRAHIPEELFEHKEEFEDESPF